MFGNCYSFTSLDLYNFETPRLFDMSSMFSECFSLKEINISNFSTDNLRMFKFTFSNLTVNIEGKIYYNSDNFNIDIFNNSLTSGWKLVNIMENEE